MRAAISAFLTTTLSVVMILCITVLGAPAQAWATPTESLAVLPGLKGAFTGERPDNLGVVDGHLAGCPASPNCVVSQEGDAEHAIAPIFYTGDRQTAKSNLIDILGVVPRTEVVEDTDSYVLAQSESRLMGFVDDTEFYFPKDESVIHVRAAARMGESDLGVNRRRLEQIRLAFNDLAKRQAAQ